MKILLNDIMETATGVPASIKTPALSDFYAVDVEFDATFAASTTINCIGIGYTDATEFIVDNGTTTRTINITEDAPDQNGLYIFEDLTGTAFNFSHDGTYVGRVGTGTWRKLGVDRTRELGFGTSTKSRRTLSGQVIPGSGGYSWRRFGADIRYKLDIDIYNDILAAYSTQIMRGFPYFILTDDEQQSGGVGMLPSGMLHFYATTDKPISLLQSSTRKFLYSYQFNFAEAF